MLKNAIIIALVCYLIYLYYQQRKQSAFLTGNSNSEDTIQELQTQLQQAHQLKQIALENQLINLAKQKIKSKKDVEALLKELEINYNNSLQEKETEWTKEQEKLTEKITNLETNVADLQTQKTQLQTQLTTLSDQKTTLQQELTDLKTQLTTAQQELTQAQQSLNHTDQQLNQTQTNLTT